MIAQTLRSLYRYLTSPMPLNEYGDYDEYWQKRKRDGHATPARRIELLSKYVDNNASVLDVGCGDGALINYLRKCNAPSRIVGVDISDEAVDSLKKQGYEAYKIDITSSEFESFVKDNHFDYIILSEVLEHIQEAEKVMLAIKDSFNKGILVTIPNAGFLIHRLRLLFGRFPNTQVIYHIKEHVRFWTVKDFLYWCDYFGFEVADYTPCNSVKRFNIDFGKLLPSIFAIQLIYEVRRRDTPK